MEHAFPNWAFAAAFSPLELFFYYYWRENMTSSAARSTCPQIESINMGY